jgi:two-component system, OmpR family, response regulator PrrA
MSITAAALLDRPASLPRPVRVLVVEDTDSVRRAVSLGLRANGFVVTAVSGAQQALAVLTAVAPDVVLTDLSMPDVDGFELIRTLRARGVDLPIVVMSARDDRLDRMAAASAGADGYLVKPFGLTELCSTVTALADAARDHGTLPV